MTLYFNWSKFLRWSLIIFITSYNRTLPPITKTIQVRRTRHAGHCWRSRDELVSDVLLWTPTHGRAKAGRPVRTYIQQLCEDTGCCPEDLPGVMNDREEWRESVRDIRATSATWWWWWLSSSSLFYSQRFCRYVFRPSSEHMPPFIRCLVEKCLWVKSSGVCRFNPNFR